MLERTIPDFELNTLRFLTAFLLLLVGLMRKLPVTPRSETLNTVSFAILINPDTLLMYAASGLLFSVFSQVIKSPLKVSYWSWTFLVWATKPVFWLGLFLKYGSISQYDFKALTRPYVKWRNVFQGNHCVRARNVHDHLLSFVHAVLHLAYSQNICFRGKFYQIILLEVDWFK